MCKSKLKFWCHQVCWYALLVLIYEYSFLDAGRQSLRDLDTSILPLLHALFNMYPQQVQSAQGPDIEKSMQVLWELRYGLAHTFEHQSQMPPLEYVLRTPSPDDYCEYQTIVHV